MVRFGRLVSAAFFAGGMATAPAKADVFLYPHPGQENAAQYTFTAASNLLTIYLGPASAAYNNELFVTVAGNRIDTELHGNGLIGSFATIKTTIGDPISFSIVNFPSSPDEFKSLPGGNADGFHHLYFTRYTGDALGLGNPFIANNNYFAFEDLRNGGDKDYNDITFVTSGINAAVPEPSTWAMMLAGLVGLGFMTSRKRSKLA